MSNSPLFCDCRADFVPFDVESDTLIIINYYMSVRVVYVYSVRSRYYVKFDFAIALIINFSWSICCRLATMVKTVKVNAFY